MFSDSLCNLALNCPSRKENTKIVLLNYCQTRPFSNVDDPRCLFSDKLTLTTNILISHTFNNNTMLPVLTKKTAVRFTNIIYQHVSIICE